MAVIVLFFLSRWIRQPYKGFSEPSVTVEFPIGTSTSEIFASLSRSGAVRSGPLAAFYYRAFYHHEPLKAGEYSFSGTESLDDIISRIVEGEVVRHRVVIPEGLTDAETFRLFLAQGVGTEKGFARAERETDLLPWAADPGKSLEGFLFPSTYIVTRSTSTRQIVQKMVEEFERHFTPGTVRQAQAEGLTPRQAVIIASFVEKETSLPAERPRIAAVYLNRLKIDMKLQCDPTVIYALMQVGKWTGKLHTSDLSFDSPYNTYLYPGLPPGPICNPGAASLAAVVSPAKTDDLYFVARGDGGHYFSHTYAGQEAMIAKSRQTSQDATPPKN